MVSFRGAPVLYVYAQLIFRTNFLELCIKKIVKLVGPICFAFLGTLKVVSSEKVGGSGVTSTL